MFGNEGNKGHRVGALSALSAKRVPGTRRTTAARHYFLGVDDLLCRHRDRLDDTLLCTHASRVATRLRGPRTGDRRTNIHPTPGTGVAPRSRPCSKSHGCSPWNSWNESFESTRPSTFSAIQQQFVSASDCLPAGGDTYSPRRAASSNRSSSEGSMRCANVASTTTVTSLSGYSRVSSATAASSWARPNRPAFGRDIRAVDDNVLGGH